MSEWFYVCCNTTARTIALLFLIDLGMKWLYFVRNSNTQWYAWLMTRKRVFIYETYCSLLYSAVCVGSALNVREFVFVCASVFGYRLVALSPLDTYNLPLNSTPQRQGTRDKISLFSLKYLGRLEKKTAFGKDPKSSPFLLFTSSMIHKF